MSAGEVHINDVGFGFDVTVKDQDGAAINLSAATTRQFTFRKPDETEVTKTPVFITDGTDGQLRYVTIAGDLEQIGLWKLQAYIVLPAGEFYSDIFEFRVWPNL